MKSKMNDKNTVLIARYLSGEATGKERQMLEDWIGQSQENKQFFEETRSAWQKTPAHEPPEIPAFEDFWMAVGSRLDPAAESLAEEQAGFLSKAGQMLYYYFTQRKTGYAWAAASVLVIVSLFGIFTFLHSPDSTKLQIYATKYAERSSVELPDGSRVELNADSRITFEESFIGDQRKVSFTGQAFFNIQKDGRPFIVQTPNAEIRVLGTRFDVRARDEKTEVIVKEGSVALKSLKSRTDSVVVLRTNENSVCQGSLPPVKAGCMNADYLIAWLEHKLVFKKTPLNEIAGELQRTFNKKIILSSNDLGKLTITGEFKDQDLEHILSSICLTLNLKSVKVSEGYLVSR